MKKTCFISKVKLFVSGPTLLELRTQNSSVYKTAQHSVRFPEETC